MEIVARRYRISGRVQGVGFRHFTWKSGNRLGLSGWVRNRVDGTVEVMAWGTKEQLSEFRVLVEGGPRFSTVDRVVEQAVEDELAPSLDFAVRSTV